MCKYKFGLLRRNKLHLLRGFDLFLLGPWANNVLRPVGVQIPLSVSLYSDCNSKVIIYGINLSLILDTTFLYDIFSNLTQFCLDQVCAIQVVHRLPTLVPLFED